MRNDVIESLVAIWKQLLQDDRIDRRSHFFDCGGDSLKATEMCIEVERRMGCVLPIGQIYLSPVLEEFAAAVSKYEGDDRTPLFIPLRNEGIGCPVFAITPAMGGVFHFLQKTEILKGDFPFFAIEPRISASGSHAYKSIRDLAIHTLSVVRNKQPQGPYRLIGYSFGGTIAWEMARVLEESGEKADLLLLLDSSNRNGYILSQPISSLFKRLRHEWQFYLECRKIRKNYCQPFHYTRWMPLVWKKFSDSINLLKGSITGQKLTVPDGQIGAEGMNVASQQKLRNGYDPGSYGGKLYLFRAIRQLTLHRELDYDLGWTHCLKPGNLIIKTIPGDHFSFMKPPHVEALASAISTLIQEADRKINQIVNEEVASAKKLPFLPFDEPIHGECLADRYLAVVHAYPEHTAIRDGGTILSFAQLHATAMNVAAFLDDKAPDRSLPILLHFETSWQYICSIYGVLLSGRCYVPVDPEFPDLRIKEIITHSGCEIAITSKEKNLCPEITEALKFYSFREASKPVSFKGKFSKDAVKPEAPAVLLFTSGSTGCAKGTIVSRKMLLHIAWRRGTSCGLSPADRYAVVYNSAFMGAVLAIHGPLLNGATLSIFNLRKRGLVELPKWAASERITVLHMITSILRRFLGHWKNDPKLPDLRLLIPGGERVRKSDIEQWKQVCAPKVHFATCLGSTECGTIAMWPHSMDFKPSSGPIPVGIPFKAHNATIQRADGSLADANEEGELVIESEYIFKGYLNADDLNSSVVSFSREGKTIYKTGDYGYIDENGILYNAGRRDSRIKINGNLVELAEIESVMVESCLVEEIAIVYRLINPTDHSFRLVAFYRAKDSASSETRLVHYLMRRLPRFMIPTRWIRLSMFPQTVSGKINRSILQSMGLTGLGSETVD